MEGSLEERLEVATRNGCHDLAKLGRTGLVGCEVATWI